MILQSLSGRLVNSESTTLDEKMKTTYSNPFSKVCDVYICTMPYRRLIDNSSILMAPQHNIRFFNLNIRFFSLI